MRSYMTCRILRQIIYAAIYPDLRPRALLLSRRCLHLRHAPPPPQFIAQRRSLFGFGKQKRQPKGANYQPGFEAMTDLHRDLEMAMRPPETEIVATAFSYFVQFKKEQARNGEPSSIEEVQAKILLTTFRHLRKVNQEINGFGLSNEDLRAGLSVLRQSSANRAESEMRIQLANALFEELDKRRTTALTEGGPAREDVARFVDLSTLISVLSRHGDALQARSLTENYWKTDLIHAGKSPWRSVMNGVLKERNQEEVEKTLKIMEDFGVSFDAKLHQQVVMYYAQTEEDMEMTKKWYKRPIIENKPPTRHTEAAVLRLCIKRSELEWGNPIFKSMVERDADDREFLDIVLLWAAAKGRGVDEIERMVEVMAEKKENNGKRPVRPEIGTINVLVEFANTRDDPYTAERYISLGQKWGLQPNTQTYLLQLDYRIKVGDLSGAMATYGRLREEGSAEDQDLTHINNLIIALCVDQDKGPNQSRHYDSIMALVEDLTQRRSHFTPETVAALSLLHLQRGETDDLLDLLNTYAFTYGQTQRNSIRDVLFNHVINPATPADLAWTTYNMIRDVFTETDVATRIDMMTSFFTRRRPDFANNVFIHIHRSFLPHLRLTINDYCTCILGHAATGDLGNLEIVYNMVKLDSNIEPDTKLRNALMVAYTKCRDPDSAEKFWNDILESREGPSYNSIQIALQSCERANLGENFAREIWNQLKKREVEITREVYAAYIGALAGHNLFDECVQLLDSSEQKGYGPVDLLMLGTFYNATPGDMRKARVKDWAWEAYPEVYEGLLKVGTFERTWITLEDDEEKVVDRETFFNIGSLGRDVQP